MYMSCHTCIPHAYKLFSYVVSELYSRVPGDRNWRHRVADIHIFVNGPPCMLPRLQELLGGKQMDLLGLTVFLTHNYYLYMYIM